MNVLTSVQLTIQEELSARLWSSFSVQFYTLLVALLTFNKLRNFLANSFLNIFLTFPLFLELQLWNLALWSLAILASLNPQLHFLNSGRTPSSIWIPYPWTVAWNLSSYLVSLSFLPPIDSWLRSLSVWYLRTWTVFWLNQGFFLVFSLIKASGWYTWLLKN